LASDRSLFAEASDPSRWQLVNLITKSHASFSFCLPLEEAGNTQSKNQRHNPEEVRLGRYWALSMITFRTMAQPSAP
jgi:hypothetical protein